ncbi:MAG: VOC family protein [Desulfobulbaceae bacterium]|jgi:catechol 2,3-dioxygenase-like lactoylglutathione lyase family enzyme
MLAEQFDHLVLTVGDIEATCAFYGGILGMRVIEFAGGRKALQFGNQKLNLHRAGAEIEPHALRPTPGSADICLLTSLPMEQVVSRLSGRGVEIIAGPVRRTGATGPILSVYFRDPDGNLIELANQLSSFNPETQS